MSSFKPRINESLQMLTDSSGTAFFLGREKSIHEKYGRDGALLLGKITEEDHYGNFVYLDAIAPHVIFIVGARGSGKSYSLGVIAEELIFKNPNVASVIIDPIGIYWSMKHPNQEEKELDNLIRMGLTPKGVSSVNVFVPYGVRDTLPRDTYDKVYALRPADLTVDEWCITFDIDRFSPRGLLIERVLESVKNGYKIVDGKKEPPKQSIFGIDDIVHCLNNSEDLVSGKKGFSKGSRRAIISRFESAKSWGIFTNTGTPLVELCREGEISVIDVSFLEEKVTSLVIGLLARKILNARKLDARKTSMKKFAVEMDDVLETGIPPTWLFIDEAHTLIPSGAKTAASEPLIEYVKQGRRPGCSLVFATQQPSAIDTKVLSQLDLMLCHKLVFDDDMKAVLKRMPTLIPKEYSKSTFVRSLPIGTCLIGDRSDSTSRAFTVNIRPRFSQHEGREARSVSFEDGIKPEEVRETMKKIVRKRIEDYQRVHLKQVDQLVSTINRRYKTKMESKTIADELVKEGYVLDSEYLVEKEMLEKRLEEEKEEMLSPESDSILAFEGKFDEDGARVIAESKRKKKRFGFFGEDEALKEFTTQYMPVYKIDYDYFEKKGFRRSQCYVDGMTGELLSVHKNNLESTEGVARLLGMTPEKRQVIVALKKGKKASVKSLAKFSGLSQKDTVKESDELVEEGVFTKDQKGIYALKEHFDLPEKLVKSEFTSLESSLVMEEVRGLTVKPKIQKDSVGDVPALFGEIKVRDISLVYRPVYTATFSSSKGIRKMTLDGMNGKVSD
ncbi:DUF853 family protein [archaeon]|nr:DUF853 family protein [archaeon]